MDGIVQSQSTPLKEDLSSDDETETDKILASLLLQLDELGRQQQETVIIVTDALRRQQQKVDVIRKSVRETERIIHQKYVSRQKAKIKRLRVLTAASVLSSSASVRASITPKHELPPGDTLGGMGMFNPQSTESTPIPNEALLSQSGSTLSGMSAPTPMKFTLMTDIRVGGEATFVGDTSFHQDEDTAMKLGEDDGDDENYSAPPAPVAPIAPAVLAPPSESSETGQVSPKPVAPEKASKSKSVSEMAAEVAAEAANNKPRPVQKMRPTRGTPWGGLGRGTVNRPGRGGIIGSSTSSRSNSQEVESAKEAPFRTTRGIGIGTGRRSKSLKKGDALGRSSISSKGSDGEQTTRAAPTPARTIGFVAVNTPVVSTNRVGGKKDGSRPPLSSFPAGMGGSRPFGEMSPPPLKHQPQVSSENRPGKNSKVVAFNQMIPGEPVLFTTKELRSIFGGGNPGSIIVSVRSEDQEKAVVKTEYYICLGPDAHFSPPGIMCDNAEMIDIYGQEGPVDTRGTIFPLLKKVNKMYMYCGDYTMGIRRILPLNEWKNGNEVVKKHWAKKVQDTEWGREFLVRKKFLRHGEIKNVSLQEIMGYFAIADDRKGLRFSATALNFHSFNHTSYNRMVAKASEDNPNSLPIVPIETLKPNGLKPKPRTSLVTAGEDNKTPIHTKKRRRISGTEVELDTPATTSVRHPTVPESFERGRRSSRNNVNYRIAPMDEFSAEEGGKGKEVIEAGDDYVEYEEGEVGEEGSVVVMEEEDEESEAEVDMVID